MRVTIVIGLFASVSGVLARGDEVPPKPPELEVLQRLVGSWNSECTEKQAGKETRITGTMTTEWVLGGRFLQCRGMRNPGRIENLQIIGFDPAKKEFRMWYFDSSGTIVGPVGGQWDENSKTLTWQYKPRDDVLLVNRVHFIDNDSEEWHATVSGKDGAVLFDQQGKSTRRK